MKKEGGLFRIFALAFIGCSFSSACGFLPPINPQPCPSPTSTMTPTIAPSPTATATIAPTSTSVPTATPVPTASNKPPYLETFRGGIKPNYYKCGNFTCADGDSTQWYYINGYPLVRSCDDRSPDRNPCDYDHMGVPHGTPWGSAAILLATCKSVALNCNGRPYDDPRGPIVTITQGQGTVSPAGNPFGFTIHAKPGKVTFTICPRENFHSCETESGPCIPVPLPIKSSNGCSTHSYIFPKR